MKDGFFLWVLFVFNLLGLGGLGVSYLLQELEIFEPTHCKFALRKDYLYIAKIGTISLTLIVVSAYFIG